MHCSRSIQSTLQFRIYALGWLPILFLTACSGDGSRNPTLTGTVAPSASPASVVIRWMIGADQGILPIEVDAEKRIAAQFNAGHDIRLELEIVEGGEVGDRLREEIARGNGPDIVGPMDMRMASEMGDIWLDLSPLIRANHFDLAQFAEGSAEYFKDRNGKTISLPFAVDPSFLYYNKTLFDAAGMNYPPAAYDEKYRWQNADGSVKELDWDVDTLRQVALRLTVDAGGKHPSDPGFRRDRIVQFGFASQLGDLREQASLFGTGSFVGADGTSAQIPDAWRAGIQWYADGMWGAPFLPNAEYLGTDMLNAGDPFNSGRVAIAQSHLHYTCCLREDIQWDLAPVPSYRGKATAVSKGASFFIPAATKYPQEAFAVLQYLTGDAAPALLAVYEQMPALQRVQSEFWNPLRARYPTVQHWEAAMASLAHADFPSCMLTMPNNSVAEERIAAFQSRLLLTPGLDPDRALEELRAELQAVFIASP